STKAYFQKTSVARYDATGCGYPNRTFQHPADSITVRCGNEWYSKYRVFLRDGFLCSRTRKFINDKTLGEARRSSRLYEDRKSVEERRREGEHGKRGRNVTGVQTCALRISLRCYWLRLSKSHISASSRFYHCTLRKCIVQQISRLSQGWLSLQQDSDIY